MPALVTEDAQNHKRKRSSGNSSHKSNLKPRKAPKTSSTGTDIQSHILLLEEQVLESREHYNNIIELQNLAKNVEKKPKTAALAALALCRIFCRFVYFGCAAVYF